MPGVGGGQSDFFSPRLKGLLQFEKPLHDLRPQQAEESQCDAEVDSGWFPKVLEMVGLTAASHDSMPQASARSTLSWIPDVYASIMTPGRKQTEASVDIDCLGLVLQEAGDSEVRDPR